MAICRNQPRAHEGQMVSGEKGGNCSALWLCVGIVERWWNPGGLTGIKPQSQESARRTNERRRLSRKQLRGLFKHGWKGMLSVSVNSVPLWFIIVVEKSILAVYVNPTSRSKIISNHPLFWLILGSIIDIMSINARKLSHRFFQLVLAPSYSCSCHVQCANI